MVFDGEGKKLAAVMKELDHRRRREREEKRRAEEEKRKQQGEDRRKREASSSLNTPSSSAAHTPSIPWRPTSHPSILQAEPIRSSHSHYGHSPSVSSYAQYRLNGTGSHSLPRSPVPPSASPALNGLPGTPNDLSAHGPARVRRPTQYSRSGRDESSRDGPPSYSRGYPSRGPQPPSSSTTSNWRGRRPYSWRDRDRDDESAPPSRSPSPIARRRGGFSRSAKQREHEAIVEELAKNGFDHVTLEGHGSQLSGAVREEDVKKFFTSFEVDKVRFLSLGQCSTLTGVL